MFEFLSAMFNLWFPMVMILLPLAIALPVQSKPHPSYTVDQQRLKSNRYTAGLCLASLIALLVHLGLFISPLPYALKTNSWILFFPLWFLLGVPLLQAKDPGWMSMAKTQGYIRIANLEVRDTRPRAMWSMWSAAVLVWIALIAIATPFIPDLLDVLKFPYVFFVGLSLLFLSFGFLIWRLLAVEPEPYTEQNTDLLARKYLYFRRSRTLLAFSLLVSAAILSEIVALMLLMHLSGSLVAWVGALGGMAIGTLGGGLGIWSSFKRAELNRIFLENMVT